MRFSVLGMVLASLTAVGCGKTKYDVFLEASTIEGEAERGPCKLHYAKNAQAASLSGDKVAVCLQETERALVLYERAGEMGYNDADFAVAYERAKGRKERLTSMLTMVRQMEREQSMPPR